MRTIGKTSDGTKGNEAMNLTIEWLIKYLTILDAQKSHKSLAMNEYTIIKTVPLNGRATLDKPNSQSNAHEWIDDHTTIAV